MKKILALLLATLMLVSLLPMTAFATGTTYTVTNGTPESDNATNHGYISIDKSSASEGDTVTVNVNPADGYQLKSLTYARTASAWGVVGDFNEWSYDLPMFETETNIFISPVVTLTTNDEFRIRKDAAWDDDYGASDYEPHMISSGDEIAAMSGGYNLVVPTDGDYIVTFNLNKETITVTASSASVSGADPIAITADKDGKYMFTMPAYPVTVTAEFEEVGGTGSGEWFGYCTEDSQFSDSIGTGFGGTSLTFAIKIPAANLPQQDVLSIVSYFVRTSGTYHVRIYQAVPGQSPDGADPDYEQEITISDSECWKDIILTTPYQVDKTKDLWIGIENTDVPYPATYSTEILETPDCCMMYFKGIWYPINELGSFEIRPWMIRGYFETVGKTLPYSFDFETDPFENGWTTIDADGDGYDWKTDTDYLWDNERLFGVDESHCAMSRSYVNNVGPRNADNWLFSPAITIPEGGAIISWYEQSQDEDWLDSYTVYVGETAVAQEYNESTALNGMKVLYAYHEAANPWTQISVELSAEDYGGKTVYIAFRHQSEDCYFLEIDDFAVGVVAPAHTHTGVKQNGQPATETAAGWKDYYKCDCGLYFEDEDCTVEIGDETALASWKTGKGAIAILVHTITPVSAQAATQTEPGFKAYYECKNCGKYYEDAAGKVVITDLSAWKAKGGNGYIPSGNEIDAAEYPFGDVNRDRVVDAFDYQMVKAYVLGTYKEAPAEQVEAMDVNGDTVVDAFDYQMIKAHVLGTYVIG